jgi:hypothetical protein
MRRPSGALCRNGREAVNEGGAGAAGARNGRYADERRYPRMNADGKGKEARAVRPYPPEPA